MSTKSEQQIFDEAVAAVLKQGAPAYHEQEGCQYLTEDGKRCAVGHLLSAEDAAKYTSCGGVGNLIHAVEKDGRADLVDWLETHRELLGALQSAHDTSAADLANDRISLAVWLSDFTSDCARIASDYGLNPAVLNAAVKTGS